MLRKLYGHVDKIEFFVGLFAEDGRPNSALPGLIGRLVGIDAFSQAFTNPLLAELIFNEKTFTPAGWEIIQSTSTLSEIVHRNIPPGQEVQSHVLPRRSLSSLSGGQFGSLPTASDFRGEHEVTQFPGGVRLGSGNPWDGPPGGTSLGASFSNRSSRLIRNLEYVSSGMT